MNEPTPTIQNTLENALISSIENIKKTGTELVDALYQQAPEVIEQLLLWHGVESLITFFTSLALISLPFVSYKIAHTFYKKMQVSEWRDESSFWIISVVSNVLTLIVGWTTAGQLINIKWLKIWLAPKVYLLEYLANFVK